MQHRPVFHINGKLEKIIVGFIRCLFRLVICCYCSTEKIEDKYKIFIFRRLYQPDIIVVISGWYRNMMVILSTIWPLSTGPFGQWKTSIKQLLQTLEINQVNWSSNFLDKKVNRTLRFTLIAWLSLYWRISFLLLSNTCLE